MMPVDWSWLALPVVLTYAAWVGHLLRLWYRLPAPPPDQITPGTGVTVVLPVRNEAAVLHRCLIHLVNQDYPAALTQLVVVDDFSSDRTGDILRHWQALLPPGRLEVISLATTPAIGSKKAALHAGILAARHPLVVTTDADCTMGAPWLRTVAAFAESTQADLVSSPVVMSGQGLLARLQALEFMGVIATGGATLGTGHPLMCNGANLAFRRQAYLDARDPAGFTAEPSSGDDTFLMMAIRRRGGRMAFLKSAAAVVHTDPSPDLRSFLRQRMRWAGKVQAYRERYVMLSGLLVLATHVAVLGAGVAWLAGGTASWAFGAVWMVKATADFLFLKRITAFFSGRGALAYFLPLFLWQLVYIPVVAVLGPVVKTRWKGRPA